MPHYMALLTHLALLYPFRSSSRTAEQGLYYGWQAEDDDEAVHVAIGDVRGGGARGDHGTGNALVSK